MVWSSGRNIPYNLSKAVKAGVRSLTPKGPQFDDIAQARARAYMQQAFDNDPLWKKEGSFCSHIVVAAYQAALLNVQEAIDRENGRESDSIESALGQHAEFHVNASRTTPLNLHSLLQEGETFEHVGKIKISKNDVLRG